MKNIILTIVLILSFNLSAQDSYQSLMFIEPSEPIELNLKLSSTSYGYPEESSMPVGLGMIIGGATFILAGVLTQPIYVSGSTTEKKPIFQQARTWPILFGSLSIVGGVVISIR